MRKLFYFTIIISWGYGVSILIGLWQGTFTGQQLLYYTILSNIIIFIFYTVLLIADFVKNVKGEIYYNVRGALTLMIIITGLIYHILLAPQLTGINVYANDFVADFLVHTYTPLAVFIDWIFFTKIPFPRKLKPFYWLSIPFAYWILAIVYASLKIPFKLTGNYYAYYFIDMNHLGFWQVLLNVAACSVVFLMIGILLKTIKQLQHKNNFFNKYL